VSGTDLAVAGDLQNDVRFQMSNVPVTDDEIISCISSLEDKKTPDMVGLSTNLLKQISYTLIIPLKHIFTQSLATGVVPPTN
jgi:hypothetical protein